MKNPHMNAYNPIYPALGLTALNLNILFPISALWLSDRLTAFDARPLFFILSAAMVVLCLINRLMAMVFASRRYDISAEEKENLMESHRAECRANPQAVLRRYEDMDAVPMAMLILYMLLAVGIMLTSGLCFPEWRGLCLIPLFLAAYLLFMALCALLAMPPMRLKKSALVPEGELPRLHELAQKAADALGLKGKVRLELAHNADLSVSRFGRVYVVVVGSRLLATCTEEELYSLLLYHFDTHTDRGFNRTLLRRYRLSQVGSARLRPATWAFDCFFSYADARYEWDYEFYLIASAEYTARHACERVMQMGDPTLLLRGRSKMAMSRHFDFESDNYITEPFYASEKPRRNCEQILCEAYRRALTERGDIWGEYLAREPEAHQIYPRLREERTVLGLDGCPFLDTVNFPAWDSPYGHDVTAAIALLDARWYQQVAPGYKQVRQSAYLAPLEVIREWEASDGKRSTPELSPVINAYRDLGRQDEAEALCDRILDTETNQFALAHAMYFKGICRIHRYEPEGIDLIYRAMDINKNYMKEGLEAVGTFCVLAGLPDEWDTFRRRAVTMTEAHSENHEGACSLTVTDRLEADDLGDMLPDILDYMVSVSNGHLEQVYLVRKVIAEDFTTSAFVLYFTPGAPDEELRHAYEAIFNYLDAYPVDHQFSLFLYDRDTERAVRKVPNSLVWKRDD